MDRALLFDQLRDILTISATEPTTYLEFISCLFDMEEEGVTPSSTKIIKRLWPEEWEQAADKIQFCATKWNLLRKRRHKINERIFDSSLLFGYFIQLTPDKEFRILYDPHAIFAERLEEFKRSQTKTSCQEDREKLEENVRSLQLRFDALHQVAPVGRELFRISGGALLKAAVLVLFVVLALASSLRVYSFFTAKPSLPAPVASESRDMITIAVMPFVGSQEGNRTEIIFNQGLSDGVISALSRFSQMMVISRNSVESYRGQSVDVGTVGEELGVRYVVGGNTYASGGKIRIAARLNDVETGRVLWSDQWNEQYEDLFSLQNEITLKILVALQVKLSEGDKAQAFARGTRSIEAYTKLMEGYHHYFRESHTDTLMARRLAEQAIAIDPDYAAAYALLADSYLKDIEQQSDTPRLSKAYEIIRQGLEMDQNDPVVHNVYSRVCWHGGEYEKALSEAKKSLEIAPSYYEGLCWYAALLNWLGRSGEAIEVYQQAARLDPRDQTLSYLFASWAYRDFGDYEKAIVYLKKARAGKRLRTYDYTHLAACYVASGNLAQGREMIREALALDSNLTIESVTSKPIIAISPVVKDTFISWLEIAGLP